MKDDRWLTRLRALAGVGLLGWEAGVEHLQQWWALFLVVWMLGGPAEDFIQLFTEGRIRIDVHKEPKRNQNPAGDEQTEDEQ